MSGGTMSGGRWREIWAAARQAGQARRKAAIRDARPRERLDPVLGLLGLGLVAGLAVAGYLAAESLERNGIAEPPVLRPAPDDRILADMRDQTAPIVDATRIPGTDLALIGRRDGTVHVYDVAASW